MAGGSRGNRIPPRRAELILRRSATAGRQVRGQVDTTATLAMMARRVGARVTRSAIWVAGGSRGNRIPPLRAELILRRSATAGRQVRGQVDTTATLAMMARRV